MGPKFPLPRRTFLKGVGAALSLPLLEAMGPVRACGAETKAAPIRMAFMSFPNGAIMPSWKPKEVGEAFDLSPTLEPLTKVQDDVLVVSGLAQDNGRAKGDGPGDHARSASTFLTGAHPVKTAGEDIRVGISVDQAAAEKVGHLTRLPSLELGIEKGRQAGNCDSGYSCAYSNSISWKSATTPMAKEINPRLAFLRLFGDRTGGHDLQRDFYRKSILDLAASDAAKLKADLGQTDQRKVDEYFTSVRELELRIAHAEKKSLEQVPEFKLPSGVPADLEEHIRLMYDLLVLAFQTDVTRIATFMLANEGSNRAYRMVGVNEGHHELSHHRNDDDKIAKLQKIDHFLITQFAYFLEKLKSIPEGEGNLLDNSMIVYGSGLSDGNRHNHHDLPVLIAGKAGGTIRTGRHMQLEGEVPLNNLFLSMLDRMGARVESLGDSTGRLNDLDG